MIHALHIGLDYRKTGNDLSVCAKDARLLASIFGGRVLVGKQGRKELMGQVKETVLSAGPGEWAVITFSGHGTQVEDTNGDEPDGWDEAVCTHEKDGSLDVIIDDEWQQLLQGRNRKARVLVIADSCFSGTIHRAAPRLNRSHLPLIRKRRMRYVPPSLIRKRRRVQNQAVQAALPNVVPMSGCADFEFSYEGAKNGVLTGALAETYEPGLTIGQWWGQTLFVVEDGEYGRVQHPQISASKAARLWRVPSV